jgi:predicted MPP superfamily phosphohydrolase
MLEVETASRVVPERKGSKRLPFPPTTRRKFIRVAATAGVAALAADTALIEPNHPRIVRQEIALRRWPARLEGFTIALLSDFHYDPYFSVHPLRAAIGIINDLHPALIVLTGDFVSVPYFGNRAKAASAAEPCAQLLQQMKAPYGLWAVMGNHDALTDPQRVTDSLRSVGIQVLDNRSVPIESNGARFWLSGVDDVLEGNADVDATLHSIPANESVVLLAHEPDYADYVARYPVDLQLSAHSHGGQVRVPFVGPLWLPGLGKRYVWGLYRIGGLTLYTNPGLGTVGAPVRMNCPPEITFLTLRRSAG